MSVNILHTFPKPDVYSCNLGTFQCEESFEETSMTAKMCNRVCTENNITKFLSFYTNARAIIDELKTTIITNKRNEKFEWTISCTTSENKTGTITWIVSYVKVIWSVYSFEYEDVKFKITIDPSGTIRVIAESFYKNKPYKAQFFTPEEIFMMRDLIVVGFAKIDFDSILFLLSDRHVKRIDFSNNVHLDVPTRIYNYFERGQNFYRNKDYYIENDLSIEKCEQFLNSKYSDLFSNYVKTNAKMFEVIRTANKTMYDFIHCVYSKNIDELNFFFENTFRGFSRSASQENKQWFDIINDLIIEKLDLNSLRVIKKFSPLTTANIVRLMYFNNMSSLHIQRA